MAQGQLAGRIAVVTGASRGIGQAVALRMAEEGAHVYAIARSEEGLEALNKKIPAAGGPATMVPLDVNDGPAIDRLGGVIAERHGKLDILVGAAGTLGALSPLSHIRPHIWDRVIETNLTANWRLIRGFDTLLRQSDAGRAIFVTSGVARGPRAYWGAYAVSKAALEMLAGIYAEETRNTSVRVNILDPGVVRTAMRAEAMPGEDPATLPPPEAITDSFLELALPSCTRHGEIIKAEVNIEQTHPNPPLSRREQT
ncbi:MAG: SDR family NAD(P)-dependent oxidoreductase [Alphaproteobacteria bacterium]